MKAKVILLLSVGILFYSVHCFAKNPVKTFSIGDSSFLLNGKPYVIRCGEMHFARIPKKYWRQRLKMAKAMGLNTVCAYLFWNFEEKEPGQFDWTGRADAAEFCRIAQQEGLYVILRPGPYSCAEWEMGGFPWWLLKDKKLQVRTRYQPYLDAAKRYLLEVGRQLAPLEITKGGNIIMVQVENEYGSYGDDKEYMGIIRDDLKEAGFNVPLFTCDGPAQLKNDIRLDIFAAVNFGGDPESGFKALREVQPKGPLMCSEFYPGWFDSWGRPHHTGSTVGVIKDLKYMLDHNESFSIYMVHGGTSFGTYSGANAPPFLPQTTSYDYDAPINESGNATPKFYAIRNLFAKYLQPGETLPPVPAPMLSQKISNIKFTSYAPLFENLPKPTTSQNPMLMEDLNQGFGSVLYQSTIPSGGEATLSLEDVHDFALIYVDGKLLGTMDRRKGNFSIQIPARAKSATLKIMVEAMGRVNYGGHIIDRKGIHGKVTLNDGSKSIVISNWKNYSLPMGDKTMAVSYKSIGSQNTNGAGFFKASFNTDEQKDTYIDMSSWNKGLVWINGICLGRYWDIGPTQTMYLPGCWLKKGKNEIVIFDLFGNKKPTLKGLEKPILDSLTEPQPELHKKPGQHWTLNENDAYYKGTFENNNLWQTVNFKAVAARYFCLEALNEFNNQPFTTIAEIMLTDANGKEIPRTDWKIVYADSEELSATDGNAANVFDLQFTSIWHTEYSNKAPKHPHQIVIDLGGNYTISGLKLLPRQDGANGRIKDYRLYFSDKKFKGI